MGFKIKHDNEIALNTIVYFKLTSIIEFQRKPDLRKFESKNET